MGDESGGQQQAANVETGGTPQTAQPTDPNAARWTKINGELGERRREIDGLKKQIADLNSRFSKTGETPDSSTSSPSNGSTAPLTMEVLEARLVEHGKVQRELGRLESAVPQHVRAAVEEDLGGMTPAEQVRALKMLAKASSGATPQQQAGGETPEKTIARTPDGGTRATQSGWPTAESWRSLKIEEKRKWLDKAEADPALLMFLNSIAR